MVLLLMHIGTDFARRAKQIEVPCVHIAQGGAQSATHLLGLDGDCVGSRYRA